MKVREITVLVAALSMAGASEPTTGVKAPPICLRVALRNGDVSWVGRFAFDTARLIKGDERVVAARDTFGNVPRGYWKLQSNDSLWVHVGFVDSGFEIVLPSLYRDSVAGRAIEWSIQRSVPWSAHATRSTCPATDSHRGLPSAKLMLVRPPA